MFSKTHLTSEMALPREFRRLRIGLVGFGDVAARTAAWCLGRHHRRHGPRLIAIGRSSLHRLPKDLHASFQAARHATISADLDHRPSVRRVMALLHAAAIYLPTAESPSRSPHDSRARHLAAAIRGLTHRLPLVYLSTTGVYGNHSGAIVSETSACRTVQPRSLRRLDAERVLRPLGAHILRVPGINDSGDRLPLARLKARQPALRAQDDVFTNHIHADDLARIAFVSLFRGRPGRITNTVDQTEMKMADYFDTVADAMSLPRPPRVSREEMAALAAKGEIHPMMMGFLADSRRVTSQRLSRELGITLQYPTIERTLDEARHRDVGTS